MKLIAFAASSSRQSINKKLVTYAASLLTDCQTEILDINDYELPLFSVDREQELGKPQLAQDFHNKIAGSDGLLIAFAEHNGTFTAAYKNLFDWVSRIHAKVYQDKPLVMLATSPGKRGGASVLAAATASAPYFGGQVKGQLAIPNFTDHFDLEAGRLRPGEWDDKLKETLAVWVTPGQ